jgi:hypothetical protein
VHLNARSYYGCTKYRIIWSNYERSWLVSVHVPADRIRSLSTNQINITLNNQSVKKTDYLSAISQSCWYHPMNISQSDAISQSCWYHPMNISQSDTITRLFLSFNKWCNFDYILYLTCGDIDLGFSSFILPTRTSLLMILLTSFTLLKICSNISQTCWVISKSRA